MRYYFNIVLGNQRAEDHEGGEFDTLDAAKAEAVQVARDVAADRLRDGHTIGGSDQVEVMDEHGAMLQAIKFPAVILDSAERGPARASSGLPPAGLSLDLAGPDFLEHFHKSKSLFAESREIAASVGATFAEIRARLGSLG